MIQYLKYSMCMLFVFVIHCWLMIALGESYIMSLFGVAMNFIPLGLAGWFLIVAVFKGLMTGIRKLRK